jgi:hypothetical protein
MTVRAATEQATESGSAQGRAGHRRPGRVTQAAVRAKCLDCLCGRKYDCEIPQCALYPWQPWHGRSMPSR